MEKSLFYVVCVSFLLTLFACGNKTESAPLQDSDSVATIEDITPTVDTLALINNRVAELGKGYHIIKQADKGRIVYIKDGDGYEGMARLYVEDVVNGEKKHVSVGVNEVAIDLREGRTDNEVYVFGIGGSGGYCNISRVVLSPLKVEFSDEIDPTNFEVKKKTARGFKGIAEFRDSDEDGNEFWESYEVEINFNGDVVWEGEHSRNYK